MSISPKGRRAKGHAFERFVARLLQYHFPRARRKTEYHVEDADGVDLQNTGPISVQCKCVAQVPNFKEVFSAMPDDGRMKILAMKLTPNKGTYVVMQWHDFTELLEKYLAGGDFPKKYDEDL